MIKGKQAATLRSMLVAGLALATVFGFTSTGASAQSSAFTAIDVPAAGTGADEGTAATAIDAQGDVAGVYIDSSGNEHGFVLPAGGAITAFDASGSGGKGIETIPIGFDTSGDIAGIYHDANSRVHGFVRAASTGAISLIDVSGEDTGKNEGTFPICINSSGTIAGDYSTTLTTSSGTNSFTHGFIRSASGTITTFDAEPLPTTYGSTNPGTYVIAMNASGEVAGFYIDGAGAEHGFLRNASGTLTTFEAPNAGTGSEQGTIVTGIDAAGDVIGAYADSSNAIHGFERNASSGTITVIDAPGAGTATYQGTYPDAFDAAGDISGSFTDANNVVHGFILPANGTIAAYDAPGAVASGAVRTTANARLNSKLRQLGQSYGLSLRPRKSNSPMMKLKRLLARVGASPDGTGLLNGSGPNPSGTASYGNLLLNAVNASGEIVGIFSDGNYVFHGYVRATNGNITSIDDPNAGTSQEQGTGSLAINTSGMIAGTYADTNSVLHGFLYDSSTLTATTTTLTPVPTPNPSVYQEPVTLTASVSSSSGTPANGENVTFMSGSTSLGTAELASGAASLTTTSLPVGTESITAVYGGDSSFAGSSSAAVTQTVDQASSSTTLNSSLNPSVSGQSVTFTADISGQFSGVATGTVTFNNGSSSLGSASVSNNMATLTTTTLPVGTDSITAAYSGDSNFTESTSGALSQVVSASTGSFGAPNGSSAGSISVEPGATTGNTAVISVVGTNGFSGTVNLTCAIAPTAASDPATCALSPTSLALSGTTVQTSTLTVSTTAASSADGRLQWQQGGGIAVAFVLLLAVPRRRRSWLAMVVLLAIVAAGGVMGCGGKGSNSGGGGNPGTTAGNYTITVTGTSGNTSVTIASVPLTVE